MRTGIACPRAGEGVNATRTSSWPRCYAGSPSTAPRTCPGSARRFVEWNGVDHGIQRVDACRAPDGELLLVELEDLNPYLSLDVLDEPARDAFVAALRTALRRLLAT